METLITIQGYTNSDIEQKLLEIDTNLPSLMFITGKQDGSKKMPVTESEVEIKVTNIVKTTIQEVIDFSKETLLPAAKVIHARETEALTKVTIVKLQQEDEEKERALAKAQAKANATTPDRFKVRLRKWFTVLTVFLGIADAGVSYTNLRCSYPVLIALTAALSIAGAISMTHHAYATWIKTATTLIQKRIRTAIVLGAAFIFFSFIGSLRTTAVQSAVNISLDQSLPPATTMPLSGLAITVISFILFLAVFTLALYLWRSEIEHKKDEEHRQATEEIKQLTEERQELQKEIEELQRNVLSTKHEARMCYDYCKKVIARAKHIGEKSIAQYKLSYAQVSNHIPEFFLDTPVLIYDENLDFNNVENEQQ